MTSSNQLQEPPGIDGTFLKVGVVGTGIMGLGIAQVLVESGLSAVVFDTSTRQLDSAFESIQRRLARRVEAGRLTASAAEEAFSRLQRANSCAEVAECSDFVIEAVTEQLSVKQTLFAELDRLCQPQVVLGTNTSQFSITEIASVVARPERVVGMHFFNPAPVMRLVELVRGERTSEAALATARRLATMLGKDVVTSADAPGFITSRLIACVMLEAIRLVQEGVAETSDIDRACRLAFNWPMGPLELADFVGLDTVLYSSEALRAAFGERYLPPQMLRRLVHAGALGKKSGGGFYRTEPGRDHESARS